MGLFITPADIETALGGDDYARLVEPTSAGAQLVARAIADAEGVALAYLSGQTGSLKEPARAFVAALCLDLVIWKLARDPMQATEDRRRRQEDALQMLRDIANGKAHLPVDPASIEPPEAGTGTAVSGDEVGFVSRPRTDWSEL